ncbi:hypothetical protein I569_00070 [Enterococcus dispar ATCC 51266]|uniref:Uncharacterized protein n=1 Tax=Enterococcus dispar ATCC 51266 TaxID=1139219 RepID=S1NXA5_9ENTE|nr:hypothetical protein OMK_01129 [Enterococcus dispar ATCC 51266]EOW84781.1 hypothetical protein I569_00070 [Enterococcus dispar ATCC 51266]
MIPKYRAWEPDTKFMQTVIVFVKPVILVAEDIQCTLLKKVLCQQKNGKLNR